MSKNKIDFNVLDKAFNSAPMQEANPSSDEKMKKLISIPVEWDARIRKHYKGTVNSYILMAIYERMQKDGMV